MRALSDYLAKEFAALGLPSVSDHQLFEGRQWITFGDGTRINVGPFASDAEIWAAIRKAFNMTDETPTQLPAVELAPKPDEPKLGGVMARGYKPGALKSLLEGLHREGQSLMADVAEEAAKVQRAYTHLRSARDDLKAHSESIMAELGQFSNFGDDD